MKRSRSIRLVLIGGLAAGATTGCGPSAGNLSGVSAENVYTNNHPLPHGGGYYHAPFRAWFPIPYNLYDPKTNRYYQGGRWESSPHVSITNLSSPTPDAIQLAEAALPRASVPRGGFGGTSHHRSFLS